MKRVRGGFSLIELLVTLAIFGILLALSATTFRTWMANMRVRTAAEAIQNGLQLARAEAVRRNDQIGFYLTSDLSSGCALSTTASNWVVSFGNPAGACDAAFFNEAFPVNDAVNNPAPRILQVRTAAEGSANVVVAADQASFVFNGLGRVTPVPGTNPIVINVTPDPAMGDCTTLRCLRVTATLGGQIRMCDPALGGNDTQRC